MKRTYVLFVALAALHGSPARAGLFDDPLGYVWSAFKEQILQKVTELAGADGDKLGEAKKLVEAAIESAKSGFKDWKEKLLQPALELALKKILPSDAGEVAAKVKSAVASVFGAVDGVQGRVDAWADAALAFAGGDPSKMSGVKAKLAAALEKVRTLSPLRVLLADARRKLEHFARSKTLELLPELLRPLEELVEKGKREALKLAGKVPYVGGLLAGTLDIAVTLGLKELRKRAFRFVADETAALASSALDRLQGWLEAKAQGKVESWLKPACDRLQALLGEAQKVALPLLARYRRLEKTFDELAAQSPR